MVRDFFLSHLNDPLFNTTPQGESAHDTPWENLIINNFKNTKNMKILVTGGAGYIGSHTVIELFTANHEPVIVDNFSNSEKWIIDRIEKISGKRPVVHEGNCTDYEFMKQVFEKEKNIEGAIHFAAFKAVSESIKKPLDYYNNNINSLIVLLRVMQENDVSNLVFSSSATVYGEPKIIPTPETSPRQEAKSPYGKTKIIGEDIIEDTVNDGGKRISAISLRYFNPIGAHPSGLIGELPIGTPSNLLPYITQTAAGIREKLTVFGGDYDTKDGTCIRDVIHVVDLAQAHIAALEHINKEKAPFYDTFNVGTGKGNSILEIIEKFEKETKVKVPYEIGPRREGDVINSCANVDKIKDILNWQAKKTLEESLRDAWKWQLSLKKTKNNNAYV